MKIALSLFTLFALFFLNVLPFNLTARFSAVRVPDRSAAQTAFEKRESAYRANNVGVALLEQYKAKEAAESFEHALEIKPDLLLARINLAIALYYLPDADTAKREAQKSLTQDAKAPQPHYLLGLLARTQNRFDEAIAEFQNVLKVDPDDVGTNVNLGQIFVQQKTYPEAIAAFRRAIAAEPYNETALYNLGLLLTRTGKREEGQQLLRKFQQLKESGAGTSIGTNYLEGGHYAEAVVSTGAEAELVDRSTPDVRFVDEGNLLYADSPDRNRRPQADFYAGARPPLSAVDEHGHDVLDLISRVDRRWPEDFKVDRIRGYAGDHSLTLKLDEAHLDGGLVRRNRGTSPTSKRDEKAGRLLLLLTGWTDYAWSSDNVAASQAGQAMKPPSLQVKDASGNWHTVIHDIGIPVGRPQTVTVDLTGKFRSANRDVRIVTNMRIYWDQILFATPEVISKAQTTQLDPMRADLHWRGFSAEVTPDGREPFTYDYSNLSFTSPWKTMTGRYTREGDVRELLADSDDMFAICRPGDEITLSFDAKVLGPLPSGWTRTFLLYADGFSKEMDVNSASPDQLLPLPFHGMSRYPYASPEHYPTDARHRQYMEKYNTRVVRSQVSFIDALLTGR
jgi:tetratricopeptide (TPR) repeat protein